MYAKLIVGSSNLSAARAMRDIGRLLIDASPSVSLITGFSNTSSIIVDSTPAGWTYVGSTNSVDRPTIAAIGSSSDTTSPYGVTVDTNFNLCFSAPVSFSNSILKYAILNLGWRGTASVPVYMCLTGAESVTSLGVATNEGPRRYFNSADGVGEIATTATRFNAGDIIHLIATPRHITIINENRGISAVWESTNTDVHTFYGKAPMIQYNHCDSSIFTREGIVVPTVATTTRTDTVMTSVFGHVTVTTGVVAGTRDVTNAATTNTQYLWQSNGNMRNNSMTSTGIPVYQVNPVFYQDGLGGYPTQYVSGVVPIYWTAPGIGTTGDAISIAGNSYTFFNCGTGFGVAMQTS
jgi:hypothetical protein